MAWRQANVDRVLRAGVAIVFLQPLAQRMSRDSHDGIDLWIKIGGPPQGLDGNAVLFDLVDGSFEVFFADEAQEPDKIIRPAQDPGSQDQF